MLVILVLKVKNKVEEEMDKSDWEQLYRKFLG